MEERREAEYQLHEVSRRDSLAGPSNRHHVDESLAANGVVRNVTHVTSRWSSWTSTTSRISMTGMGKFLATTAW